MSVWEIKTPYLFICRPTIIHQFEFAENPGYIEIVAAENRNNALH